MAKVTKDTKVGESFAGKSRVVSWERLWAFSGSRFRLEGWPSKNIHTDVNFAKGTGLPKVAASGTQPESYLCGLMVDMFGVDWFRGGRMEAKFIELIDAGDIVTPKAMVQAKEQVGEATKFTLDVFCDNQRSEKVVVGQAIGYAGHIPAKTAVEFNARVAELMADPSINHDVQMSRTPLEPFIFKITPELNQQYCYACEDYNPIYFTETEIGDPIAHPGLLLNWSNGTRSPSYGAADPTQGGLHAHDEAFWYNTVKVGKKITVMWDAWPIGTYEKRGRMWRVSGRTVLQDEDGNLILRRLGRGTTGSTSKQAYRKG